MGIYLVSVNTNETSQWCVETQTEAKLQASHMCASYAKMSFKLSQKERSSLL